jgi:hypothetical protein
MSKVSKPARRKRVRSSDLAGVADVPLLRQRAVRALKRDYAHVFADPVLHKRILNFLYTCYLASAHPEPRLAHEFWRAYRHFVEGRSILDFPFTLIDRDHAVNQLRKILRGDPLNLDLDDND